MNVDDNGMLSIDRKGWLYGFLLQDSLKGRDEISLCTLFWLVVVSAFLWLFFISTIGGIIGLLFYCVWVILDVVVNTITYYLSLQDVFFYGGDQVLGTIFIFLSGLWGIGYVICNNIKRGYNMYKRSMIKEYISTKKNRFCPTVKIK